MANEVSVAPFLMTGASGNQLDEVVWFGARVTRPRSWPEVWLGLKVLVWTGCLSDLVLVADLVISSGARRKGFGSLFWFCSARVNASCCVAVFAIGSTGASVFLLRQDFRHNRVVCQDDVREACVYSETVQLSIIKRFKVILGQLK